MGKNETRNKRKNKIDMIHLKLYEQFEIENDPWGEDTPREYTFQEWFVEKYTGDLLSINVIDCSRKQLTSLEGIENLKNLKSLFCSQNKLNSLKGIENLINLENLNCSDNLLTSLEGIEKLKNLVYLFCHNNSLISLKGIENLDNLDILDCSNNLLTCMEEIENCKNLFTMWIWCQDNSFTEGYTDYLINYYRKEKNIHLSL